MKADDFVKIVRCGQGKLRVDEILINAGSQELHGKGMLEISREKIEIHVTLNKGENLPEIRYGVYSAKDYWQLTGIIEDQLPFKCDQVGPIGNRQFSWPDGIVRCTIRLHPVELISTGWDAMSHEERMRIREELLKEHNVIGGNNQSKQPNQDTEQQTDISVYFYALLLDYDI